MLEIRILKTITKKKVTKAMYPNRMGSPIHTVTEKREEEKLQYRHMVRGHGDYATEWIDVPVIVEEIDETKC